MATVIERPADRVIERREIVERSDSGAGWAIALVVLVALLVAGFVWARYYRAPVAPQTPNASINVSVPQVPNTGSAGSGSTGGSATTPGNTTGGGASPGNTAPGASY